MTDLNRPPLSPLDPDEDTADPLIGEVDDPDEIRDREIREDIGIEDEDIHGTVEEG